MSIILFLVLLLGTHNSCVARIPITGSTTWTASRSVDQQIVIEDGVTLTIQGDDPKSPIILAFSDKENVGGGIKIFPSGRLILENVIMMRDDGFDLELNAISFVDGTGGFASLNNVRCQNMSMCIQRWYGEGNQVIVKDSTFYNNTVAIDGEGRAETVKASLFVGNKRALRGGNWIMEDCFFLRNGRASDAENTKFVRSIFVENEKAVMDPLGNPSPFLEDCLFYRNGQGILPSSASHASLSMVSFVENGAGIYCSSKMSTLDQVNFMNNTEWNVVYTGTEDSDIGNNVYWGATDAAAIAATIFDGNRGTQSGIVMYSSYASESYLHDIVVTILKRRPTTLLNGLEKYFANVESTIESILITTETTFDFTKLKEWADDDSDDHSEIPGNDQNKVPVDVADDDDMIDSPSASDDNQGDAKAAQDSGSVILFLSVAVNICFVWILSVAAYEYFCRPRWAASVELRNQKDKEEKVQLMEQDGWISYEENPIPLGDVASGTRSSPFNDDGVPAEISLSTIPAPSPTTSASTRKLNRDASKHTIRII